MDLINFTKPIDLQNFALIVPSVSVGNVAQLSVDIIISTYNLQKVGTIWHPAIISSVGSDPFDSDSKSLCTACELFANEGLKVAAIQIRSGIEPKYANEFFESLTNHVKSLKFRSVVLLASAHAYEMHDVSSSKFRYLSNALDEQIFNENNVLKGNEEEFHGAGFALKLYKLIAASGINCTLLVKFASEGDNRPDAVQLLNVLQNLMDNLQISHVEDLKFPTSWNYVFGNPPPLGLY